MDELNFPWEKKLLRIFCLIYNFIIAISRIHFAICEVRSDDLNPGIGPNFYHTSTMLRRRVGGQDIIYCINKCVGKSVVAFGSKIFSPKASS